eukprot:gene20499-27290_t
MQSWRYRVSYAELAVQSQLCRVGGTESAMQSWRYRVSYAELADRVSHAKLAVQSTGIVGGTEQPSELAVQSQLCKSGGIRVSYAELRYQIQLSDFRHK